MLTLLKPYSLRRSRPISPFAGSVLLAGLFAGVEPLALADSYAFTTINYPGAIVTVPIGINNAGQISGYYENGPGSHGFLYNGGTFTTVDVPSAPGETSGAGINNTGLITGSYSDATGTHGFVDNGGTFTPIDVPSATGFTVAFGINDSGLISGYYVDGTGNHGFLDNGGTFTILDNPSATPGITYALGINNPSQIVGYYYDAAGYHGFLYSGGSFTTINHPSAPNSTVAFGINSGGQIVGYYIDGSGQHGYVYSGGTFTTIDDPSATGGTTPTGINDTGLITGFYNDGTGSHGFLATPPPPPYVAAIQPPINSDGSGVFSAKRGVVPVKFTLTLNSTPTCQLPPATVALTRTAGSAPGPIDESVFLLASDSGSNFRIDSCQYVYNLATGSLGPGTYLVQIKINGNAVGSATFGLQ